MPTKKKSKGDKSGLSGGHSMSDSDFKPIKHFPKKGLWKSIVVLFVWMRAPSCCKKHFRSFRPSGEMKWSIKSSYRFSFIVVVMKKGPTIFSLDIVEDTNIFGWMGDSINWYGLLAEQVLKFCAFLYLLEWNHALSENTIFWTRLVRCEIKNPATKLNSSWSITSLQFVTSP